MSLNRLFAIIICIQFVLVANRVHAEGRLSDKAIHLPLRHMTVSDLLQLIQEQGVALSYVSTYLPLNQTLSFKSDTQTLDRLLGSFLTNDRIHYLPDKVLLLPPTYKVLTGYVYDQNNGEALIGAILYEASGKVVGISNEYGYYSVSVPWDSHSLSASFLGYQGQSIPIQKELRNNFFLRTTARQLAETVVFPRNISEPLASVVVDVNQSEFIPSVLGGDDIIQRLSDASGAGSQNLLQPLSVRGDPSDYNLVLLDGVPVYSYMHIFSLFSIFNSNAIQKATLYKGLYPSKYEGRLGAILDIRMKDGNKKAYSGSVSVDLATVSAMLEGPIVKDKSSFMLSVRRSWLDALYLFPVSSEDRLSFSSFDFYLKANFRTDFSNQFYVSHYLGGDWFYLGISGAKDQSLLRWNNYVGAVRWNHIFSDSWFANHSLSYSRYRNRTNADANASVSDPGALTSTLSLNTDFVNKGKDWLTANLGYRLELSNFETLWANPASSSTMATKLPSWNQHSLKASVYAEFESKISSNWNVRGGLNYVNYYSESSLYQMLQPRVQWGYRVGENSTVFAGYSRMGQFYYQITWPLMSTPYELRVPSSGRIKPAMSDLYELGVKGSLTKSLNYSGSVYYKSISNQATYRPGQNPGSEILATKPEDRIIQGSSRGWGVELEGIYSFRKWKVDLAYSYSNSRERYDAIQNGEFLSSRMEVPHRMKSTVFWFLSPHSGLYTRLSLSSGMLLSYPLYTLPSIDEVLTERPHDANYYSDSFYPQKLSWSYQCDVGYASQVQGFSTNSTVGVRVGVNNLWGTGRVYSYSPQIYDGKLQLELNSLARVLPYLGVIYRF